MAPSPLMGKVGSTEWFFHTSYQEGVRGVFTRAGQKSVFGLLIQL